MSFGIRAPTPEQSQDRWRTIPESLFVEALGLEGEALDAVRIEHTQVLPGLGRSDD